MLMQRQPHILSERQRTEQGPILKQHAKAPPHPPELAFWEREQILPPIKDMPLHGPRKPDDVP